MSAGWAFLADAVTMRRELAAPSVESLIPVVRSDVTAADVASLPAVAGAVRLIASTIDQLPLTVTRGTVPSWLRRPRAFGSALDLGDLVQHTVDGMVRRGYGALRCIRVGESWRLDALTPSKVQPRIGTGQVVDVSWLVDGVVMNRVPAAPADAVQNTAYILPIPYLVTTTRPQGTSPLIEAADTLAGHVATEQHASRLFDGGTHTGGLLASEQDITRATAERYRDLWLEARRNGTIPVLGGGLSYKNEVPDPGALQLIEARAFNQAAVYMLLGIPPSYMGASLVGGQSSLSYANAQDNRRLFRQSCLEAFTSQISDALSTLVGPGRNETDETRIEFDYQPWEANGGDTSE